MGKGKKSMEREKGEEIEGASLVLHVPALRRRKTKFGVSVRVSAMIMVSHVLMLNFLYHLGLVLRLCRDVRN